jgi:hypothetical protein
MVALGCSAGGTKGNPDMMMSAMCTPSGPEVCDGKDNDCNGKIDDKPVATANKVQLVASEIMLPLMRTDYAIDLNGDGKLDNQLQALVAVLKSQGTDANKQIQNGILNGDQVLLVEQMSNDSTYTSDACSAVNVYTGKAHPMPNLMGGGSFTIDSTVPAGNFTGTIAMSEFTSVLPENQATPVTLTLDLVMFPMRILSLPLIGAHVSVTRDTLGNVSGQIQGAIKKDDVQKTILPTFAAQVQEQVMNNPNDPNSQSLLKFFDDGGNPDADASCGTACKNSDGSCAKANDGKIDICEVTSNGVVQNVMQSDVQMFTDDGSMYKPNPANTHKDSMSLGISFKAVQATF